MDQFLSYIGFQGFVRKFPTKFLGSGPISTCWLLCLAAWALSQKVCIVFHFPFPIGPFPQHSFPFSTRSNSHTSHNSCSPCQSVPRFFFNCDPSNIINFTFVLISLFWRYGTTAEQEPNRTGWVNNADKSVRRFVKHDTLYSLCTCLVINEKLFVIFDSWSMSLCDTFPGQI